MIANVADAVQRTDIDTVKAHGTMTTDLNQHLAALFVAGFLARWNLCETAQSVHSEMPSLLPPRPSRTLFLSELDVKSPERPLAEFVQSWSEHGSEIAAANRKAFVHVIDERFAGLPRRSKSLADQSNS
jgi:hypothetical protein